MSQTPIPRDPWSINVELKEAPASTSVPPTSSQARFGEEVYQHPQMRQHGEEYDGTTGPLEDEEGSSCGVRLQEDLPQQPPLELKIPIFNSPSSGHFGKCEEG